ncbi:hypothetical protein EGH73_12185 [Epilithonimonas hominis]|uniref:Uncharacterized protein n=1 Tax=Epilithonimonas hominis TaxID=420404 RepID=A0A3N0X4F2_9FLAO|nr:hypothetical protein EGH73_12185 [Epilithonimonas hominis]HAP95112.1 hypothetical protein [Chryseobacterium sp.]
MVISLLKTTAITFLLGAKDNKLKVKTDKNKRGKRVVFFIGLITLQNYKILIKLNTKVLIFNIFLLSLIFFRENSFVKYSNRNKKSKLIYSTWILNSRVFFTKNNSELLA